MTKLDEVIDKLLETHEILCDQFGSVDAIFNLDISMDALRELNKPVQTVVSYKIVTVPSKWFNRGKLVSWAVPLVIPPSQLNYLRFDSIGGMKDAILKEFNASRKMLALPPITIEQITFVEV